MQMHGSGQRRRCGVGVGADEAAGEGERADQQNAAGACIHLDDFFMWWCS
jgi:hypothetical protein